MSFPQFWPRLRHAPKHGRPAPWRNRFPRRLMLEQLEERTLLTITTQGLPDWIEQGPGPNINGQVENITTPNNPVAGAINAIAADPSNSSILYVATVNGGICRTTNATAASPSWFPLTDRFPSLSFRDIAIDPQDHTTLYAGTARTSSSGHDG